MWKAHQYASCIRRDDLSLTGVNRSSALRKESKELLLVPIFTKEFFPVSWKLIISCDYSLYSRSTFAASCCFQAVLHLFVPDNINAFHMLKLSSDIRNKLI